MRFVRDNALALFCGLIFVCSAVAESVVGDAVFNEEQLMHGRPGGLVRALPPLGEADIWETTMQNWQSEFLAIGMMKVLSVYLRQRGSPESKPVGAPHSETGSSV